MESDEQQQSIVIEACPLASTYVNKYSSFNITINNILLIWDINLRPPKSCFTIMRITNLNVICDT